MRLINSDGQIVDARVEAAAKDSASANANSNSVRFDLGAVTMIAALAVMLVSVAISVYALADAKGTRDLLQASTAYWERSFSQEQAQARRTETEARVAINHYMQAKAKQEK